MPHHCRRFAPIVFFDRWWSVDCVSCEQTVISSSWGCLLFVLWYAVATNSNRKTNELHLSWDLVVFDSICGEGVDDLVSAGLVHLFEIWIALYFWGWTVIHNPEYLFTMNLLTLLFNSSSMAFRMSPIVVFVAPSDFSHCLVLTHCVSPAPSLVSVGFVVCVPGVPVALVHWQLFGIGSFNSSLLVSIIDHWFCVVILPILLTSSFDFWNLLLLITPPS